MITCTIAGRIGHDAELKYGPDGTAIMELNVAANYGKKGVSARPTQWIRAAMFGKRAETLAKFCTKGTAVTCLITELHIEEWKGKDGTMKNALRGYLQDVTLQGGGRDRDDAPAPKKAAAKSGGDDFDLDVPF